MCCTLHREVPHINVLTKCDLVKNKKLLNK